MKYRAQWMRLLTAYQYLGYVLGGMLLLGWLIQAAHAADGTTVDFTPLLVLFRDYASAAIEALIGGVIVWVLRFLHLAGNVQAETLAGKARDLVHAAAERGLDRAVDLIGGNIKHVDVRMAVVADALDYIQANARDAVKRLGAAPEDLERLLEALLAQIAGSAEPVAAPAAVPPQPTPAAA